MTPGVEGGFNSTSMLLIIAIVGTTVAPWQLFFQQSNVIDKRITPRWINYERADTVIGSVVVILGAAALMIAVSFGLGNTPLHGQFGDAGTVASGLAPRSAPPAGPFALALLNAAIIGAAAVTLGELVRVWRRVPPPALAAPPSQPGQAVSRQLRNDGHARRGNRADPRRAARHDHDRRAGSRRHAAPSRPYSCCCCATTRRCSARGRTRAG